MASGFFIPPWRSLRRSGSDPPPKRVYSKQRARPTHGQQQHMANTVNTANAARAAATAMHNAHAQPTTPRTRPCTMR
eukprot:7204458-Prymnesium_polylepis.1